MFFEPPRYQSGAGIGTEFGTLIPPGANVAGYVRSGGPNDRDHPDVKANLSLTLNAALAKCRAGKGDYVFVMPDHAENVASADAFSSAVAGTNVVGLGAGSLRPTFTWTTALSTWLFNDANFKVSNCIFEMAGPPASTTALSVAAPITVSADGCEISRCKMRVSVDADQLATIPITTTAGGTNLKVLDNYIFGATTGECTTVVRVVGADHLEFSRNQIVAATSVVGIGLVQFITTDSLFVRMFDNVLRNNKAASEACVSVSAGATTSTGQVDRLFMTSLANGANQLVLGHANGAWGLSVAAFSFGRFINVVNLAGERAAEVTVVSA